jgi:hypothetical protein
MKCILIDFCGEEELKKHLGTISPGIEQRSKVFETLWDEYGPENELNMNHLSLEEIIKIREEHGSFDVINRYKTLRFSSGELAMLIRLKYPRTR